MIGSVSTATICAYSFARLRWPGRDIVFGILLATMMLPSAVRLIPLYIFYKELHWIDTFKPLIIPAYFGGGPFIVFLLRQFFLTIPGELEEAATIDGANPITILWNIMVPLARPALVVVAIFEFQYYWNGIMGPLIYLTSESHRTLSLGLAVMASGLQFGRDLTHLMMAVSTMMVTPIIGHVLPGPTRLRPGNCAHGTEGVTLSGHLQVAAHVLQPWPTRSPLSESTVIRRRAGRPRSKASSDWSEVRSPGLWQSGVEAGGSDEICRWLGPWRW